MLTDEKTVLVARANTLEDMGSALGRQVSVEDSAPIEFRNHLSDWLAVMTEAAGVAAVLPEIVPTAAKTDSPADGAGTTSADGPRIPGRAVAARISRS